MILCICPNPSIDMFAWIDDIRPGKVNRIQKEKRFPGGKGVHVALAVSELGGEAQLLSFWGGATGQWIKKRCGESGVRCHGPDLEGWSRTCMTFVSDGSHHETEVLGCGPTINEHDYAEFIRIYRELVVESDAVCFSGSWPQGAESNYYAELIRIANQMHKITMLDCTGEQLDTALTEHPTVVHMNKHEAEAYFNANDVHGNAILLSRYCQYAALTSGADGLHLIHNDRAVHAKCVVEKVNSAVGSGDCLLAGLAVALSSGMEMMDAARLAVACGAANCMREDLGMLYRKDVHALLPQVEIAEMV